MHLGDLQGRCLPDVDFSVTKRVQRRAVVDVVGAAGGKERSYFRQKQAAAVFFPFCFIFLRAFRVPCV